MPADFSGKWITGKSEGWEAFLKKYNIPLDKIPADIKVTEEITQSGDTVTVKTTNNKDDKVKVVTMSVGNNHRDTVVGGVELEFTTAWDGGRLVLTRTDGKGSAVRELDGDQMLLSLDAGGGVVAKTWYSRA